jgi:hypothetical protein
LSGHKVKNKSFLTDANTRVWTITLIEVNRPKQGTCILILLRLLNQQS